MHVLRYIWKHLSNHDVFEAHMYSVPVHACWPVVIIDAQQKKLDFVVGPNEGVFERPCIVFV